MQVSQLRRVGQGLGEFEVRVRMLSSQGGVTAAQFVPQSCLLQMTLGLFYGEQATHSWSNDC